MYRVAANCDDWNQFQPGAPIELVRMGGGVESIGFMKGHFYFDAGLVVLELIGFVYFACLIPGRRKEQEAA